MDLSTQEARTAGTDVPERAVRWGFIALLLTVTTSALMVFCEANFCACQWTTPFSLSCRLLSLALIGRGVGFVLGISFSIVALIKGRGERWSAVAALTTMFVALSAFPSGHHACVSVAEATAIGDIRTINLAQSAYAQWSGGRYTTLECLANPAQCVRDHPPSGPVLDAELLSSERRGYTRTFHPGPRVQGAASSSALESWAYTAIPIVPGRTGARSFCGDDRGLICHTLGAPPPVTAGRCDMGDSSPCQRLPTALR